MARWWPRSASAAASHDQCRGQPRPVHALVHALVELRAGAADGVGVQTVLRVRRLEPLGGGQHVVGQAHAGGGPVHVHVHVQLGGHHGLVETRGVADHGQLVAAALDPDARTVRLSRLDGLEHRGDVAGQPVTQALVLGVAEARVGLFLGHAQRVVGMVQAEGLHDVVARLDVAGAILHDGARLADAAHEDVEDGVALRGLRGVASLVGRHAQRDAGVRAALDVDLDGLLDLAGVEPADLGRLLERPFGHVVLHDLERGARLLAVRQRVGAEHLGVEGGVEGVGHGDGRVGFLVPHHVLVFVAEVELARAVGEAAVLVHEEGQVGPFAAEVLVPQLVLDDVVHPGQHQRHVGAGTDGQPHVGARGVGREARVDDDGLHAVVAQVGDHAARGADAVVAGPDAPHDVGLRGRALVVGQDAGQVHLGHRAVGQRRVGRAVQAELHVVAR